MYKSQKIALDVNNEQRSWFAQQCGYARFAYNSALSDFKSELAKANFLSASELNTRFNKVKKEQAWTKSQDQVAANKSIFGNLASAISNWVSKRSHFPKFKHRGSKQSYTTNSQTVEVKGTRIKLPKIGWIKMFQPLRFKGRIVEVTISRTADRWFVSLIIDIGAPQQVDRSTSPVVGIDVGINTLATLDNGTKYDNPRPLKHYERKLRRANRSLSRKVLKSKNWFKQKAKVTRIHYKIACIRQDAHHKVSTDIIKQAGTLAIETLKVTNMLKNRKLAKALADSALGGFLAKLKTKAETLGIPVIEADQFFASSKTCSSCGKIKKELTLLERTYQCDVYQYKQDRDVNAAINLKHLAAGHAESINACG
jgi:putative transposase